MLGEHRLSVCVHERLHRCWRGADLNGVKTIAVIFLLCRPTVDERHGNIDNAVEVDMETGVLKKSTRPGMGTILANERVGERRALCGTGVWRCVTCHEGTKCVPGYRESHAYSMYAASVT